MTSKADLLVPTLLPFSFSFPRPTVRLIVCSCMDFFMDKFYGSPGNRE